MHQDAADSAAKHLAGYTQLQPEHPQQVTLYMGSDHLCMDKDVGEHIEAKRKRGPVDQLDQVEHQRPGRAGLGRVEGGFGGGLLEGPGQGRINEVGQLKRRTAGGRGAGRRGVEHTPILG